MKKNYLLRPVFGQIGWGLLLVGAVLTILAVADVLPAITVPVFSIIPDTAPGDGSHILHNEIGDEVTTVLMMVGLLFIAFSAEQDEDEMTDSLRLRSWFLASIAYGVIYIAIDLLVYGFAYLYYIWLVQGGLLLFIYIVIFKTKLYLSRRDCDGE